MADGFKYLLAYAEATAARYTPSPCIVAAMGMHILAIPVPALPPPPWTKTILLFQGLTPPGLEISTAAAAPRYSTPIKYKTKL